MLNVLARSLLAQFRDTSTIVVAFALLIVGAVTLGAGGKLEKARPAPSVTVPLATPDVEVVVAGRCMIPIRIEPDANALYFTFKIGTDEFRGALLVNDLAQIGRGLISLPNKGGDIVLRGVPKYEVVLARPGSSELVLAKNLPGPLTVKRTESAMHVMLPSGAESERIAKSIIVRRRGASACTGANEILVQALQSATALSAMQGALGR